MGRGGKWGGVICILSKRKRKEIGDRSRVPDDLEAALKQFGFNCKMNLKMSSRGGFGDENWSALGKIPDLGRLSSCF